MAKGLGLAVGMENVHSHRGQHTFASRLFGDGMDAYLDLAMQLTRHRSVQAQLLEELLKERR
jgi:integrase